MSPEQFLEWVIQTVIAGGGCRSTAYKVAAEIAADMERRGMFKREGGG